MDGEQYEEDEEIVVPTRNTRAYKIYNTELELKIKRWYQQRCDYEDKSLKLYHDIWGHINDDSKQIIRQYLMRQFR